MKLFRCVSLCFLWLVFNVSHQVFADPFSDAVKKNTPKVNVPRPHLPQVHVPQFNPHLPQFQRPQMPQVHRPQMPQVQRPAMPQVNPNFNQNAQMMNPQNTPFDIQTWQQTMRFLDEQRRLQMDNQPMPGRDYTKVYIENVGVTTVSVMTISSGVPIPGESNNGSDSDDVFSPWHTLAPGQKVHIANTPDTNFFFRIQGNNGYEVGGSINYNINGRDLGFAEQDMGQRYHDYNLRVGESREDYNRRVFGQQNNNGGFQLGNDAGNNGGSVVPAGGNATDERYDARLGIWYEPVRYSNGQVGLRITRTPDANSPVASVQFDPGDVVYALDSDRFTNFEESRRHYGETKISYVNSRNGQKQANMIMLAPLE